MICFRYDLKSKNKQVGFHQTKELPHSKENNQQKEKAIYGMLENIRSMETVEVTRTFYSRISGGFYLHCFSTGRKLFLLLPLLPNSPATHTLYTSVW